jgi:hypothetical protein
MRRISTWIAAGLIAALLAVTLSSRSRVHAEAKARDAWKSRAEQAGSVVMDLGDPARPGLLRQLLDDLEVMPARDLRMGLFVPNQETADRILPMLAERTDILVIHYHLEDVSASTVERMRSATPETDFLGYNPPQAFEPKVGRHIPGKDYHGVAVAEGAAAN